MSSLRITRRQFTVGSAVTAALSTTPLTFATPNNKLKIGVLLPVTGLLSQVGITCATALGILDEFLDSVGLSADVSLEDTESSVDVSRSKAEKLISGGAQVLVGAFSSSETAAIAQVCEQKETPFVINMAAAPQITEQGYKYVFRNFQTGPQLVENGLGLMKDLFNSLKAGQEPPKTAVLLHVNDTYGQAMRKGIDNLLPKMDMPFKLVESISYDPSAKSLSTEIKKLEAHKPGLIMPVSRLNDVIMMVRELVKQRVGQRRGKNDEPLQAIISPGSPGMYEQQFYKRLGKYSEYMITNTAWFNPKAELAVRAKLLHQKKYPDKQFDMNVAFTLEALYIASYAAKVAGSLDKKAIRDAVASINLQDRIIMGGPISFDAKGQAIGMKSASLQNLKRKPQVIFPTECREASCFVYPMPGWNASDRV